MPAQHDLMRNTNALSILENIRTAGATTRRGVQFATGLGWATVSTITAELIESGVLVEHDNTEKLPGRTPTIIDFSSKHNLCIGVEINIEGIVVVLLDLRGKIIASAQQPVNKAEKEAVIAQTETIIDEVLAKNGLTSQNLMGIGVAVQGSVDAEGKNSLYNHYIDGWRNVPISKILEEKYHITAEVQHDPTCIALYEQQEMNFSQDSDFVLIRLAFGIGMGYINGGQAVGGYQGTAGELGHMLVNPEGPECICGNRGCLEAYCSVRGVARRAYEIMEKDKGNEEFPNNNIAFMNEIFTKAANLARSEDEEMKSLFDEAGYYLGIGIANLVNVLNPKRIIISGSFCEAADLFYEKARKIAKQHSWPLAEYQLCLSHDKKGAAVGAALRLINRAFTSQDSILLG